MANKTLGTLQKTGQNSRLQTHLRYLGYCMALFFVPIITIYFIRKGDFYIEIADLVWVILPAFLLTSLLSSIIYAKKYKLSSVLHLSSFSAGILTFSYIFLYMTSLSETFLAEIGTMIFFCFPCLLLGIGAIVYSFLSTRQKYQNAKKRKRTSYER